MKNVTVFGATGDLGKYVVDAAVAKGLKVRTLVSSVTKLCVEGMEIFTGDVYNIVDVKATLEGQDAAIALLDTTVPGSTITWVSEGWKNIIAVMEALGINVVSSFLTTAQPTNSADSCTLKINAEFHKIVKTLDATRLHWVMARVSQLDNQPPSGYFVTRGCEMPSAISKYDLAQFLVDSLSMPEHYQKVVAVCSNPRRIS